jgi:hypothetical protein
MCPDSFPGTRIDPENAEKAMKTPSINTLIALLFSRLLLFALFQALLALALKSWNDSEKYWMLVATLGNVVSILWLYFLFKQEGGKYLPLFHFDTARWKKDLPLFLGLTVLLAILALVPNFALSMWLWGDPSDSYALLFRPVPNALSYVLLVAFPVTIALAELPTYFGYIMPRLKEKLGRKWLAIALPVFFLSIQHCCLPLIFDARFILYRGLMYLPFACLIGIVLWKRPRLLPYFVVLHGLMDMQAVIMLILEQHP